MISNHNEQEGITPLPPVYTPAQTKSILGTFQTPHGLGIQYSPDYPRGIRHAPGTGERRLYVAEDVAAWAWRVRRWRSGGETKVRNVLVPNDLWREVEVEHIGTISRSALIRFLVAEGRGMEPASFPDATTDRKVVFRVQDSNGWRELGHWAWAAYERSGLGNLLERIRQVGPERVLLQASYRQLGWLYDVPEGVEIKLNEEPIPPSYLISQVEQVLGEAVGRERVDAANLHRAGLHPVQLDWVRKYHRDSGDSQFVYDARDIERLANMMNGGGDRIDWSGLKERVEREERANDEIR